uniref:Uncharacterized protein LOC100378358 n=1 Tax=Saccoglossus kowalevskii TaxID=10224 RepID=A0ABM0GKL7_SACKO|nr:PREDICTED: uncharacterized protein LOC100378358 [Saccoglossus kowalevskii]
MVSYGVVLCVAVGIGMVTQARTVVTIYPHSAVVPVGSRFEFECISNPQSPSIRWHLQQEVHTRITLDNSLEYLEIVTHSPPRDPPVTISALKIDHVESVRDSGSYICSDVSGSSFTALLTVHDRPYLRMTTYPENPMIAVGTASNITLYCDANGEDVKWRKNGVDIDGSGELDLDGDNDEDVHLQANNTLMITGSDVTDAGLYGCYIEYVVDDVQLEENRTVDIQVRLQVIGPNSTVYAMPGQTVSLQCTVYSIHQSSDHLVWVYENTGETVATIYPTGHIATAEGYGLDTTKPNRYDLIIYDVDSKNKNGDYDCYLSQNVDPDGKVGTVTITKTNYGLRQQNKKEDNMPRDVEMAPDITSITRIRMDTRKQDACKTTVSDLDVCRVYKTPSRSISSPY